MSFLNSNLQRVVLFAVLCGVAMPNVANARGLSMGGGGGNFKKSSGAAAPMKKFAQVKQQNTAFKTLAAKPKNSPLALNQVGSAKTLDLKNHSLSGVQTKSVDKPVFTKHLPPFQLTPSVIGQDKKGVLTKVVDVNKPSGLGLDKKGVLTNPADPNKKVIKKLGKKKIDPKKTDPTKTDPTKTDPGKGNGTGTGGGTGGGDGTGGGNGGNAAGQGGGLLGALGGLLQNLGGGGGGGDDGGGGGGGDVASTPVEPVADTTQPAQPAYAEAAVPQVTTAQPEVAEAGSVDLVLEDVKMVEDATVVAGPAYSIRFRNQGLQASGKFVVAAVASLDAQFSDVAPRATLEVPGLYAGEMREVTLRLPPAAMQMGTDSTAFTHLILLIDATNAISELDETNNSAVVERGAL